jgi:hypothetical protein
MSAAGTGTVAIADRNAPGRALKVFRAATLLDERGAATAHVPLGGTFRLRLALDSPRPIAHPTITLGIDDTLGHRLLSLCTPLSRPAIELLSGPCMVECRVENFPLAPGEYWVKLGLATVGEELDEIEQAVFLTVVNGDAFGEGRGIHRGLCVAPSQWSVTEARYDEPAEMALAEADAARDPVRLRPEPARVSWV